VACRSWWLVDGGWWMVAGGWRLAITEGGAKRCLVLNSPITSHQPP